MNSKHISKNKNLRIKYRVLENCVTKRGIRLYSFTRFQSYLHDIFYKLDNKFNYYTFKPLLFTNSFVCLPIIFLVHLFINFIQYAYSFICSLIHLFIHPFIWERHDGLVVRASNLSLLVARVGFFFSIWTLPVVGSGRTNASNTFYFNINTVVSVVCLFSYSFSNNLFLANSTLTRS